MSSLGRRILCLLTLPGCLGVIALAAPETKVGMTVQLPPFLVETASGPPWRYTEIPRFEILSRCNDVATGQLALAFHRANQLLGLVLPPRFQLGLDVPQTLIFYNKKLWPAAEQDAVAAMLHTSPPAGPGDRPLRADSLRVTLEPLVAPSQPGPAPRQGTGRFFSNLMLADADSITAFALVTEGAIDPQAIYLTSAYVANLLDNRTPALPLWFTTGFMRLYGRMEFRGNAVTVRPIRWEFSRTNPALPASTPPEPDLLPFADFLGGSAPADHDLATWLAQTELFVSWALDPANGRTAGFWDLVARACTEPVTEALFRECLGLDFAEAARHVGAYALNHRGIRWILPEDLARPPPAPIEDASPGQVARIKGNWERLEAYYVRSHQPDLEPHYVRLARRTLHKAYDRADRDPRLLASLGLLELDAGDKTAAQPFLEEAVQHGVIQPRAYFELARLRYEQLLGRSTRNDGKFTALQVEPVLQPLLAATRQSPPLSAVYDLIVQVCANRVEPPTPEELAALAHGARLFLADNALLDRVAALHTEAGAKDEAQALFKLGLNQRHGVRTSAREHLLELSNRLLSDPAPAAGQR